MADITNPLAQKFVNEQIRPAADKYAQLYYFAKTVTDQWTAQGLAAIIPNDASPIIDSDSDGRFLLTGAMVNGLIGNLNLLISDLEAASKAKLNGLLKMAVNTRG